MPKPIPFRYPGGKFYALGLLKPFWEAIEHDEYREPFAGGATVFFNKDKVRYNWLNDLDSELVTTYKVMQDPILRKKLIAAFQDEIATPERWREVYNFSPSNEFEIAWKYFYLNRTSFSGKLASPSWGYRPKRSLPPERWKERIAPCGELLSDVKLSCQDCCEVISAEPIGKKCLMYVDPPYYQPPKNKHYRVGFTKNDHIRLEHTLSNVDSSFFLTYDDCKEIRELYSWANIYETEFVYRVDNSAANNGHRELGFELIITNYPVKKIKQMTFDGI